MNTGGNSGRITRRGLLKATAAAGLGAAFPAIVPSSVFGATAPSNRVTLGHIGVGGRGSALLRGFLALRESRSVAVADPFTNRREGAAARIDEHYGGKGCKAYRDFRELLARDDIDGVVVATPDHWHVPIAMAAARAGKDMYVEKPLGLALAWDIEARREILRYGCMFQYGTQQRSSAHLRFACELVHNGRIGEIKAIEVHAPAGRAGGSTKPIPVPEGFDYDLWLGPAPRSPYTRDRCTNAGSYFVYDNSIGFLGGWGAHPLDIAVWGWDLAGAVPVEYEGTGNIPAEGLFNTVTSWRVRGRYANGMEFSFRDGPNMTIFYGTKGTVWVSRSSLKTDPPELKSVRFGANELHLPVSRNHGLNFVESIKTRNRPVSHIIDAVRSDTISHLSDIAIRTGRKIKWDPVNEKIIGDEQASRMLNRALRAPWRL
ncbi:MAG: Gfo/Idh/MocA family oxidoreductase [Planctomycetes bacterium]|nr:Gfo/Idh/MocA family oxidoreductase [Planctomycetota bacterium]